MKRLRHGIWLTLICVAAMAIGSPAFAQINLLVNPGFEDAGGSYDGWFTFGSGPTLSLPGDDNIIRAGVAASKIFGEFTGCPPPPPVPFHVGGYLQAFTPTPGNIYEFTGYSFVSSADVIPGDDPCDAGRNRCIAQIAFFDAATDGNVITRNEVIIGDGTFPTDEWIPFSVSAPAPPGALRVEALILFLQPQCDTGAVYIDDTAFYEYSLPTPSNRLANPNFDSDPNTTGWTTFGEVRHETLTDFSRRTVPGGAKIFSPFVADLSSGMFQGFSATPGSAWRFDVYAMTTCEDSPIGRSSDRFALAKLVFRQAGALIDSAQTVIADSASGLGTWTKYTVNHVAPAGTDSVDAFILFLSPTCDGTEPLCDGSVFVDDASLWEVANPTGIPPVAGKVDFVLHQNVPNPFNPSTRIDFDLDRTDMVAVSVYDVAGRHVTTLFEGELGAGPHHVTWDGKGANGAPSASGIYWYVLRTSAGQMSRSMVLMK
ncbi:MAG: hypothetical protein OEN01_04340 [Candidatus Krumholzibacteria bacterium]|nr:hypothetical protein [Candidatus Krumholzibacteria bacterium]